MSDKAPGKYSGSPLKFHQIELALGGLLPSALSMGLMNINIQNGVSDAGLL